MILRRVGNKNQIANKILPLFPDHKIYIEPFFGAGGMFFNKPKVQYNLVNDIDSDVYNLFMVLVNRKQDLIDAYMIMPIHQDLLNHWRVNKETDPIKKALRFLLLSNFTFLGKQDTLRSNPDNSKNLLLQELSATNSILFDVQFFNKCFRKFLKSLSLDQEKRMLSKDTFIYADGPYLDTINTYSDNVSKIKWSLQDSEDLFSGLIDTKCKFAISEFDHPNIISLAKEYNLTVHLIGERSNLKNKRIEILVTNYAINQTSLFSA